MSRTAAQNFRLFAGPRIKRARALAERYPASREVLNFCAAVLEFQQELPGVASPRRGSTATGIAGIVESIDYDLLLSRHRELMALVSKKGTATLRREGQAINEASLRKALGDHLNRADTTSPRSFFARALLQRAAADLRLARDRGKESDEADADCPFCGHAPQAGCLRPLGHGLELSLVCSLCFEEWRFERGRCPACGESRREQLAYYSSEAELKHIQVAACESCGRYLHLVDLGEEPRAIADVDELAALPLDVWARETGLRKLQPNLAGI